MARKLSAGMNECRAAWAHTATIAFQQVCKTDEEDVIPDLICDLLHLARKQGLNPSQVMARASANFAAEERGQ